MSSFLPSDAKEQKLGSPPPRNSSSSSSSPPIVEERERTRQAMRKEGRKAPKQSLSLSLSLPLPLSSSLPQTWKRRRRENSNKTTTPPKPDDRPCLPSFHALAKRTGWAGLASPQRKQQQRRRTIFFPSSHAQKPTAVRYADRRPMFRHEVPPRSFRQAPVELHGACCVCPLRTTCQPVLRR